MRPVTRRLVAGVLLAIVAPGAPAAPFVFASVDEARAVLGKRDEFVAQLSAFDRAARMKSATPVREADFLAFAGRSAVAWDPQHKARVEAALAALKPRLARLDVALPEPVLLVATTGQEEGQAEYTRGNAIVLPRSFFASADKSLEFVLAHELFHVLSRQDAELREDLYEVIGFERCDKLALPTSLASRKITNPDAPISRHCIGITWNGDAYRALPVLYADAPWTPQRGGEIFDYLQFRLLLDTSARADSPAGSVRLVKFDQVAGFFEKVGNNTTYVIHPEEILADNFAQILTGQAPATPAIHESLRERLFKD